MNKSAGLVGMALAIASWMAGAQERREMPTVFDGGHFYATPTLSNGQQLKLLVDTGGAGGAGWYVLYQSTATRLGLVTGTCRVEQDVRTVKSIAFRAGHGLAATNDTPCHAPALIIDTPSDGEDGQLGAGYLPGHVWTFDYPGQKLWLEGTGWKPGAGAHRVDLGFPREEGKPVAGFARITLTIDGAPLDMLLDTGATAHPTDAGMASVDSVNSHGINAATYITTSTLDQWRRKHPQWRVIEAGENLESGHYVGRLIQVPEVTIAGWTLGPVWFTERPDGAFGLPGGMSKYMDKPVLGAVGGNVFRHFRMTIDYPNATAWFACATGCTEEKAR